MEKGKRVAFVLGGLPGLGHVTPGLSIVEGLSKRGVETHIITYANGARLLRGSGYGNVHTIDAPTHQRMGVVPWNDMFESTDLILPILKRIDPHLVVVDGEWDSIFLLKGLGKRVVALTTKTYVEHSFGKYSRYGEYADAFMRISDRVLVHGIERPSSGKKNIVFVGPLARQFSHQKKESNVVPINVGFQASGSMVKAVKTLIAVLKERGFNPMVIGDGRNGSEFVRNPLRYFSSAPVIVSDGGMAAIEEAAVLGKKILLLCDDDEEKNNNARSAERLGYGTIINVGKRDTKEYIVRKIDPLVKREDKIKPMRNGTEKACRSIAGLLGK